MRKRDILCRKEERSTKEWECFWDIVMKKSMKQHLTRHDWHDGPQALTLTPNQV